MSAHSSRFDHLEIKTVLYYYYYNLIAIENHHIRKTTSE